MKETALFFLITSTCWSVYWVKTKIELLNSRDRNINLQKENSNLIDINLELQEEIRCLNKEWSKSNDKLCKAMETIDRKKEIIGIQDKLLDENNIKH